jgi:hypothetical protein
MIDAILHWPTEYLVHTWHFEYATTAIVVTLVNSINLRHNFRLLNHINKIQAHSNIQNVTTCVVFFKKKNP